MTDISTLLIVDDSLSARKTLEGQLFGQNYNLIFAHNGPEALRKIAETPPDVILLDVMMPDMSGIEVCQQVKAEPKWCHIPVILITALDSKQDLAKGFEAGAEDFLTKPVNSTELRARIRSMLRIKHQYDDLQRKQRELEASLHLNQKFSQAIAQHVETLEVLHSAGLSSIKNNLNMDSVVNLIAQTALDLNLEADGCVIYFLADEAQALLPVVFPAEGRAKMVYPIIGIEKIIQRVIETNMPRYIADVTADPHSLKTQLPELRALLAVPLIDDHHPLGALCLYSAKSDTFEERHGHVLSILAHQAAVTISKARFFEEKARSKEREKQTIRNLFQRYVSPTVVERLVDNREGLTLGGKRQEVTILFADIRGFTTFSENLPPERLVEVLNHYLALAVDAILEQQGTLDKFMGDAVMALFNAPLPQLNHTMRAVRSALAMQQAIARHNESKNEKRRLSFGIGLHVGTAVVGNIGTVQQMNYTAIGDTVNVAKRLQEIAEGGQIILSQAVYQVVKDMVRVEELGLKKVKGRSTAEYIYSLRA